MNTAVLSPHEEPIENRHRWTVDDAYRLHDLGFLDGRFEILNGLVVEKMGQKPSHYFVIMRLTHWANQVFGDSFVRVRAPIRIPGPEGIYNEPEPDLAVTREDMTSYSDRHPASADLLLVVEVSDTTLRTDLEFKAGLYARAQIPEYWALDLASRRLHVHRNPQNGVYNSITVHSESESVQPLERVHSAIQIAAFLPSAVS